jgi:UTP--glucose-1-phosphate uridylyltransferase
MNKITKAVFPVAGMGTRFLPATKASAKEMMPVVDKPLIQYAVEEAVAAGMTEMIFITGRGKRAIEDHFDKAYELEAELESKNKPALLEAVRSVLPAGCRCIYIRQIEPLGLGHAVLCSRPAVGNEPFAVLLADELVDSEPKATEQLARPFNATGQSVIGVLDVPRADTSRYGIVSTKEQGAALSQVTGIVEKPRAAEAPSTLAVMGRYVLTPAIFDMLEQVEPGTGGEIQLTDGISALLAKEPVHAMRVVGNRYDCGSKLGYLKATVELGLRHPEVGAEFAAYLRERNGTPNTRG